MPGRRKKTTTVTEEVPDNPLLEDTETTGFDLELQKADDAETVDQILKDHGISGVLYRFYDNDGGYCYSSSDLDYDRARTETGGGKNCKLGVFINGKVIRMVPFPLAVLKHSENNNGIHTAPENRHSEFLEKMVLALISRDNNAAHTASAPSLADMTQALKNIDELRGKQESTMDLFLKGVEFAQSADGKTDWKTDLIRTGKDILPGIMQSITGMRQPGTIPQPTPTGEVQPMPQEQMIKAGIQYLKKKAISGVDPDLIIEWVANNAEEYQGLLSVILNQEFSDIAKLDPEIAVEPFLGWFTQLFDGLRRAFSPQDTVDGDTGGNLGNADDPGNHGKPRTESESKPDVSKLGKNGV